MGKFYVIELNFYVQCQEGNFLFLPWLAHFETVQFSLFSAELTRETDNDTICKSGTSPEGLQSGAFGSSAYFNQKLQTRSEFLSARLVQSLQRFKYFFHCHRGLQRCRYHTIYS